MQEERARQSRALARLVLERGAAGASRLLRAVCLVLRTARAALLERAREAWQRMPPPALALFRARAAAAALRDSAELDGRRARRTLSPLYAVIVDILRLAETSLAAASDLVVSAVRVGRAEGGRALAKLALDAARLLAADALTLVSADGALEPASYEPWRPPSPGASRSSAGRGSGACRLAAADEEEGDGGRSAEGRFAAMFELADPPRALASHPPTSSYSSLPPAASPRSGAGCGRGLGAACPPAAYPPPPDYSPPPPPTPLVGAESTVRAAVPTTTPPTPEQSEQAKPGLQAESERPLQDGTWRDEQRRRAVDPCAADLAPAAAAGAVDSAAEPLFHDASASALPAAAEAPFVTLSRGRARGPRRHSHW